MRMVTILCSNRKRGSCSKAVYTSFAPTPRLDPQGRVVGMARFVPFQQKPCTFLLPSKRKAVETSSRIQSTDISQVSLGLREEMTRKTRRRQAPWSPHCGVCCHHMTLIQHSFRHCEFASLLAQRVVCTCGRSLIAA